MLIIFGALRFYQAAFKRFWWELLLNQHVLVFMRHCLFTLFFIVSVCSASFAQTALQDFTGLVIDKETQQPITSVDIRLLHTTKRFQIASDSRGYFQIRNIPVGVYDVFIRYIGYKTRTVRGLKLQSGETPFVWVELEKQVDKPDYIEVREFVRSSASSRMSYGSVESVNPITERRWAGGFADVAGGLSFVPGVTMLDDISKDYSMNGAPAWMNSSRIDGIAVANLPGNIGITTNPYSSLVNAAGFNKSDMYSGASAVSSKQLSSGTMEEWRLKPGNFREHQGALELNTLGGQVNVDGPLHGRKSLSQTSYRLNMSHKNYEQALLSSDFGGQNLPTISNASLHMSLPTKNHGTIRLFGATTQTNTEYTGGNESIQYNQMLNGNQKGSKSTVGFTHLVSLDKGKMNFTTRLGYSSENLKSRFDSIPYQGYDDEYYSDNRHDVFDFNADMVYLFNEKSLFDFGFETLFSRYSFEDILNFRTDEYQKEMSRYAIPSRNLVEYTLHSAYQLKYSNKLKLNIGLRYNFYEHTRAKALLPSLGFCYDFSPKSSFTFQYAKKGQLPPATLLYEQQFDKTTGEEVLLNKDLGYIISDQIDANYQFNLGKTVYGKLSAFFHKYSNVPVINDTTSYYSYFNYGREVYAEFPNYSNANVSDVTTQGYVDSGKAKAFGVRMVLEKNISNGFYVFGNGSLVKSWYTTRNGSEFTSAWNSDMSAQGILGYTFPIGSRVVVDANFRYTYGGGPNLRGIDSVKSLENGYTTYDRVIDYSENYVNYQRMDFHLSVLWNMRRISHEFILDCRNLSDKNNTKGQYYNKHNDSVDFIYHAGRLPMISYRVCF